MRAVLLTAVVLCLSSSPVLAAQPADGVYACLRGDVALGDIEIVGTTAKSRPAGGSFGEAVEYVMLDDVSVFWLGSEPEILTAGGYRVDNTKVTDGGLTVTVLAENASDFETVTCTAN